MRLALQEAKKGEGYVSPNPLVGCVILDVNNRLLAKGFHAAVGQDHAEVDALKKVEDSSRLKGAQVFVTLEPCAHEGRTPSCAKRLAQLPIRRVVYGLQDPNPLVSGKGADILLKAGFQVEQFFELQDELNELPEVFLYNMKNRRSWVTLKVASSLDGRIALASGKSQWITEEGSREKVQWLRGCHDAVMVGAGTVRMDNPTLNIRHPHFSGKANKVVVLDPRGESLGMMAESNLLRHHAPQNLYFILDWSQRQKFQDSTLQKQTHDLENQLGDWPVAIEDSERGWNYVFPKSLSDGGVDLLDLSEQLYEKGLCSVLCEGGSRVFGSFLRQRAAQRLVLFQNASVLGEGMGWSQGLKLHDLAERVRLKRFQVEKLGNDLMLDGRL